jgi:hypothetical protein
MLDFMVFADAEEEPECKPKQILIQLFAEGKLKNFMKLWSVNKYEGFTNCHEESIALMADLNNAEMSSGWTMCSATKTSCGTHSWIEYDGWAIDTRAGDRRPLTIMDSNAYRKRIGAQNIICSDAKDVGIYLITGKWPITNRLTD